MDQIKAGVIGAGVFASFHARKYSALAGVELVGIYDRRRERAERLADALAVSAFLDLDDLLAAVHVATVATSADSHAPLAERAVAAGRHVYVEKPLATTLAAAEALVAQAARRRLVLACGHQERVVFAAMGLMDAPETPLRIESIRRGTPNDRNRDVSCVLDLMIHDLDLALALGGEVLAVEARGGFDEVSAEVMFRSGMKVSLQASRIAAERARTMRLIYPSGSVAIDFLAPSFHSTAAFALDADFATTAQGRDPLGASVYAFLDTVRGVSARPVATGEEGLLALRLALEVERAAGLG